MVRPAGFEPATYGFEVRTPESSQPPHNSEVIGTKGFSVYQILSDFLDLGRFWNAFHTQIHTRNCFAATSRLKVHPQQQVLETGVVA